MKGYIYILSNPSFVALYKVGKTTKHPLERAKELSEATGVPTPFKVEYFVEVENFTVTELLIHKILQEKGFRISHSREFFNANIKEIKKAIRKANSQFIPMTNRISATEKRVFEVKWVRNY